MILFHVFLKRQSSSARCRTARGRRLKLAAVTSALCCSEYADAINSTGYFSGCSQRSDASVLAWLAQGRESALQQGFLQLNHGA